MVRPRRSDTVAEQILARGVPSGPGSKQTPQSARASDRHGADHRERDRPDPLRTARGSESRPVRETLLRSRNDSGPFPFFWKCGKPTRSPQREPFFEAEKAPVRTAEVHGSLFEYLGADLVPPRQTLFDQLGVAGRVDGEHATSVL